MKIKLLPLLTISLIISIYSCIPSNDKEVQWNDSIINTVLEVENAVDTLVHSIGIEGIDINREYQKTVTLTEYELEKVKALEDIQDGDAFKAAAIEYISLHLKFLENEAKGLITYSNKEGTTDDDYDKLLEALKKFDNEADLADEKLRTAQDEFATKKGVLLHYK
jgi:hypothetical protein